GAEPGQNPHRSVGSMWTRRRRGASPARLSDPGSMGALRGAVPTRILVYTGKGGVGKTSVAAATALMTARLGKRTIVLSTDIAHSLADAFGVPLGPEPSEIAPNLWGQEPDVYHNIGRYWKTIQAYMAELFSWRGLDAVMAEEMTVLPGMDE